MENYSIDIILSTFNPNLNFLKQQLDSIKSQSKLIPFELNIIIRDDFSFNRNEILTIIENFKFKNLIFIQGLENIGFLKSYNYLLSLTKNELVFICDQDDLWHNEKVYLFLQTYFKIKNKTNPIVIASDATCIDSNNKLIKKSSLDLFGYNRNKTNSQFFLKNYLPGCSIAVNRTVIETYLKSKNYIGLHDHLLILIAVIYGELIIINKSLTEYRLHNSNTLGIVERDLYYKFRDIYYCLKYLFAKYDFHEKSFKPQKNQIIWLYSKAKQDLKSLTFFENFTSYFKHKEKAVNGRAFFSGRDFGERMIEWILFR